MAYVSLMDVFGSQIKGPAVFRFELYEKVVRSSEPKGNKCSLSGRTSTSGAG